MSVVLPGQLGLAHGPKRRRELRVVRLTLTTLLVCAGYYAGGAFALTVRFPPAGVSFVWPSNAILLAALLLTAPRTWWLYLLAALPTHLHLATHFQPGVPVLTMFCQFAGNSVQAVIAALAVRRFIGAPPRFDTLRNMAAFILLAAVAAPAVASAVAAGLFVLTGWTTDFGFTWRQRFLTNVIATVTIAPLIVVAVAGGMAKVREAPPRRCVEFALLAFGLLAVGIPVFGWQSAGSGSSAALFYAPLPFLLWAAVRFGPGGLCLSLLAVTVLSLVNAFVGRGPFTTHSPRENVLELQLFLLATSLPLLLLAALLQEQHQTAAALRASERHARNQLEQLAAIYRTAPVGLVFHDRDLRYVSINDRMAAINGLPAAAHVGRTPREVLPDLADQLVPLLRRVVEAGAPLIDWEIRGTTASQPGVPRDWIASYYPVKDERGVVVGVNAVVQEITERKRAEAELRASEERYRALVTASAQAVWRSGARGEPISRSSDWLEPMGESEQEMKELGWLAAVHPDDRARALQVWEQALQAGEPYEDEFRVRTRDGSYRDFHIRGVPIRAADGSVCEWVGTDTDVTEQKRAAEALRQARAELAHASRVMTVGELAASIAHEVNQPLAALVANAAACRRLLAAPAVDLLEFQAAVEEIARDGTRASEVIARIRSLLKRGPAQRERLDLNGLIREVVSLMHSEVRSRHVAVQMDLAAELAPVEGDRVQLQQVVLNLLLNALEAMNGNEEGPRELWVGSREAEGGWVEVQVKDTGVGLGGVEVERLFEAFYTTKAEGMGMGLAITRRIVEGHGGRLWATSNPNRGATIHVVLPAGGEP